MYIGTEGLYSYTFKHEKRPDCPVCGGQATLFEVKSEWTVQELVDALSDMPNLYVALVLKYSYVNANQRVTL